MLRIVVRLVILCLACLISTSIGYARINPNNIMGMWLLDEGQGDTAKDSSGHGNNGSIIGAKWTDGKFGKGLQFDGKSHVEIPASKTTNDIYDGFTYTIWVRPTANPPNENTRLMERAWHNPTIQIGPAPDFYGSISVGADQANSRVRGGSWKMNEWSFVALTYDGTSIRLYVDDEMVNEAKVGEPDVDPHPATPADQGNAIWLGAWKAVGWDFTGVLDEVGALNTALGDEDINDIMNNGLQSVAAVSGADKAAMTWGNIKSR